jgi:hypothetical protein
MRFLATTPMAVWHAAQPSLDVCHEQGMFAMAPGAHAFVCAWVQPKVWAVMGQLAIVLAPSEVEWRGSCVPFHGACCCWGARFHLGGGGGVQFAFPLLPSLGLSGVLGGMGALGGFDGLRPGTTLAPVWGGIVVGLSAGFAIVLRWAWERRPRARDLGRVGLSLLSHCIRPIIRCVLHVVYWSLCTVIMQCTCFNWPVLFTHPVLAFLHAYAAIVLLVLVALVFSMTGQHVRYGDFVQMLCVVCSSPHAQLQFASLILVVLTAELSNFSDEAYNTVVSLLTNDTLHVVSVTIITIDVLLYYLPDTWQRLFLKQLPAM